MHVVAALRRQSPNPAGPEIGFQIAAKHAAIPIFITQQQPLVRRLVCGVAHLSSCAMPRRQIADRAQPMKHLDPKKTNRHPAPRVDVFLPMALRGVAKALAGGWDRFLIET